MGTKPILQEARFGFMISILFTPADENNKLSASSHYILVFRVFTTEHVIYTVQQLKLSSLYWREIK